MNVIILTFILFTYEFIASGLSTQLAKGLSGVFEMSKQVKSLHFAFWMFFCWLLFQALFVFIASAIGLITINIL